MKMGVAIMKLELVAGGATTGREKFIATSVLVEVAGLIITGAVPPSAASILHMHREIKPTARIHQPGAIGDLGSRDRISAQSILTYSIGETP